MTLQDRADEIGRLFAEASRHAALGELTEAAEHGRLGADLCDEQIADLMAGSDHAVHTPDNEEP